VAVRADENIRAKCFHPSGNFIEFPKEDVETSIPERFEKIVRLYPDRLAVKEANRAITYEELNQKSDLIAHAINHQAGGNKQPIALLFEAGIEAVSAILGALKAGKCYLPLDPSFPAVRMQSMLEDSQADLLVTDRQNRALVTEDIFLNMGVLDVNDCPPSPGGANARIFLPADTPSFIIYTSGSTGRPKGVLQTHRTVLHTVMSLTNLVHFCAEDRLALLMTYSFSASIRQLFGALLNGATLLPFDIKKEGFHHLANWLEQESVTLCGFTGSMFRHFLSHLTGSEKRYGALRVCFVGSESVSKNDIDLYKQCLPDHTVVATNMGTNETGGIANLLIDKQTQISGSIVPAGYPADDKEIILLNDTGKKVGIDAPGEIVVKSEYLSPGYWRQPELTATKFIGDDSNGRKRTYLTGDLGQISPDGRLHYLGRKDLTVKVRGFNIETPKIEMALLEHSNVKQAAVVPRKSRNGDIKLTAYIVPTRQPGPSSDELRRLLKETFPDYMIPSIYVELEELPITPTGKIDRKALPEPDNTRPRLNVSYTTYRNGTEKLLIKIWEEALDICPIGVHDNFFDLGGDSLVASRIVSRVIQQFELEIPLQSLFQSPTIVEMACVINQHQEGKKASGKELEQIWSEVESLSDDEAQKRLSELSSPVTIKE